MEDVQGWLTSCGISTRPSQNNLSLTVILMQQVHWQISLGDYLRLQASSGLPYLSSHGAWCRVDYRYLAALPFASLR